MHEIDGGADESHQVHFVSGTHTLVLLHPAERQQIVDQAVHPPRLALHGGEKPRLGGTIVFGGALQRFDESGQGGEGGTQFVAHIGHEV